MRFKSITLTLLLLLQASICISSDLQVVSTGGVDFVIPKDSPVKFSNLGEYPGQAKFEGRFIISGTYHYGYLTDDPAADATYEQLELYFLPDDKVKGLLPYWKREGNVKEIRFKNEKAFVKAVIPETALQQLKSKKRFSINGRASILVKNYEASVECDYPTYSVDFISIYHRPTSILSQAMVDQRGC